jgi:predicted nucleic acid-binding protein
VSRAVLDASTLVAAVADSGPDGRWAETCLLEHQLVAPHLMPVEVANVLRRAALAGEVSDSEASVALRDALTLDVELIPFEPIADRAWDLRANLTVYDAWYVALAESIDAPLLTLDRRLLGTPGLRCELRLPPERS